MSQKPKIVVVPTYNERANIRPLIEAVMKLPGDYRLLVVDDDSPDGTGTLADELAHTYPRLHVLHRKGERGLGRSYVDGMKWALEQNADLVFQMDADFSHDPAFLPRLAAQAEAHDLVVGSRYCLGGRIEGWAARRRVLSRFANCYVRSVIGLRTRDNTGAFRCWRAEALARIDLDSILSDGYAFMVEMLFAAHRLGLRMCEIPIVFVERREGQSKLSKRVLLESVIMPWRLVLSARRARRRAPRDVP